MAADTSHWIRVCEERRSACDVPLTQIRDRTASIAAEDTFVGEGCEVLCALVCAIMVSCASRCQPRSRE